MKKIDWDKEEFLENYQKGLNDSEIGKIYQVSTESVRKYRISLGLTSNFKYSSSISKETLEYYVNQDLSDYKIANITGINSTWIYQLRKKYNLTTTNKKYNPAICLTKRQEEIFIGHVLGDGYLNNDYTNCFGKIEQGEKQMEYAIWKHKELENLCSECKKRKRKTTDPRNGKFYISYSARIKSNPQLNKYYPLFYKNGIKYISDEILDLFTPLSLAVLFMDDGYMSKHSYCLSTNCFDYISLEKLKNKLFSWGIYSTIRKNKTIYICVKSKNLFENLIKEYIIPSMYYKLHVVT